MIINRIGKVEEEKKAWALIDAGYDGSFTGPAYASVFFQNSNNSVRVTDAFLDAVERRWIEELGGMNLFFVFDDGTVITPPLGTILPGITRDSLMRLMRDEGLTVREEPYSIDQWRADAHSGRLVETMACGTAAVVTPVGTVVDPEGDFTIGSGGPGQLTEKLRGRLTGIQTGRHPDPHGWVVRV